MPVRLNSTGGGSVTLDVPATSGTFTINLPAASGSIVAADGSGNVGIGTASPGQRLDVIGNGRASGSWAVGDASGFFSGTMTNESDASKSVTFSADPGGAGANSFMRFNVDGAERMRINALGNVGIGTDTPAVWFGATVHAQNLSSGATFRVSGSSVVANFFSAQGLGYAAVGTSSNHPFLFTTNDTERMRIATNGDVGIGPSATNRLNLSYNSISGEAAVGPNSTGGNTFLTLGTSLSGSYAERMRIDASGNVGIGTTAPGFRFEVKTDTNRRLGVRSATALSSGVCLEAINDASASNVGMEFRGSDFVWISTGTERARLNSDGYVLCGTTQSLVGIGDLTTATGAGLSPLGWLGAGRNNEAALYLTRNNSDGRIAHFYRNATNVGGISVTTTGTSFNTSSDYRLKENVQPMTNGLATVLALKPVTYAWKANGSYGEGFIAHELQQAIPLAVEGEKDAVDANDKVVPQAVDYSKIVVHLVAAVQELKAENDALKARLAAVEAR